MDKERYELIGYCSYRDTETGAIGDNFVDLLNQQNKRIKRLESKLRVSNSSNASLSLDYNELKKRYDSQEELLTRKLAENSRLTLENQQLKDQVKKSYQEGLLQKQFDKDMEIQELKDKIEQLEQAQKQLAISELKKLLDETTLRGVNDWTTWVYCIKAQIKLLKGEE